MALSKELPKTKRNLPDKVIDDYINFNVPDTVSIGVIYDYIGGEDNNYLCCDPDQSIECYQYAKQNLLQEVESSDMPLLVFEERNGPLTDVIVVVQHLKKKKGDREHILLNMILRHTLETFPKAGFARKFFFTGKYKLYKKFCFPLAMCFCLEVCYI